MIIQKATKKDVKELAELDKEASKEIKWWTPMKSSEFSKLIKKKMVYVAEDKDKVIAYLNWESRNKKQVMIDNVYVQKKERKKGVAKQLIKRVVSDFKHSKFKNVKIKCPERLKKFYEKLGFGVTALVMVRELR